MWVFVDPGEYHQVITVLGIKLQNSEKIKQDIQNVGSIGIYTPSVCQESLIYDKEL